MVTYYLLTTRHFFVSRLLWLLRFLFFPACRTTAHSLVVSLGLPRFGGAVSITTSPPANDTFPFSVSSVATRGFGGAPPLTLLSTLSTWSVNTGHANVYKQPFFYTHFMCINSLDLFLFFESKNLNAHSENIKVAY